MPPDSLTVPADSSIIHIVDDDQDVRDSVAMLMRSVGLDAKTYASGKELLAQLRPGQAGCLILDIRMPQMSGTDVQSELKKRRINLPIIFLTGYGDVPVAVRTMKAGAFDFIQKPLEEHRLVVAVLNALRQQGATPPVPIADVPSEVANRFASLSVRENEVLRLMVAGLQNREIAERLHVTIKTVEFHRANIRDKLGASSTAEVFRLFHFLSTGSQ